MSNQEVINFFSDNYFCRKCFNNPSIIKKGQEFQVADVKGPQPRWVGKNYFNSDNKICVMLINPGSGDKTPDDEWAPLKMLSNANSIQKKEEAWEGLMETNKVGMPKWGAWKKLYLDALGLGERLDDISFMNRMLCASKGNSYSKKSLDLCFSSQSSKLLTMLSPDILIFSGGLTITLAMKIYQTLEEMRKTSGEDSREINRFNIKKEIKECLNRKTKYFYMGHYSYIKSEDIKDAEIIKKELRL